MNSLERALVVGASHGIGAPIADLFYLVSLAGGSKRI